MPDCRTWVMCQGHWEVRKVSSRRERVRFGFRMILLAAMWWVDKSGETGWEPRESWSRKSSKGGAVGKGRGG